MIGRYAAIAAITALCAAGHASAKEAVAAQLGSVKGAVMVNQGGKMVPAAAGALKAGDRVVAANGSARLTYADGCVVTVPANGMATISAASPCATGTGLVSAAQGASAQTGFELSATNIVAGLFVIGTIALVAGAADEDIEIASP